MKFQNNRDKVLLKVEGNNGRCFITAYSFFTILEAIKKWNNSERNYFLEYIQSNYQSSIKEKKNTETFISQKFYLPSKLSQEATRDVLHQTKEICQKRYEWGNTEKGREGNP